MEFISRKCRESDLPSLVNLCQNHALYEQVSYATEGKEELLKQAIFSKNPPLYCHIIEVAEKVVGYFSYTIDFSTWEAKTFLHLDCLYLEPEIRGFKIGEAIFEELKGLAQAKGCCMLQWQTPVFNEKAIRFYHRMGATSKDKVRFFLEV